MSITIFIPFVSALCYLIGGQIWKPARWFVGVPVFIISIIAGHSWYCIFAVLVYWGATSIFSYGDNMIWSKIFGRWVSMGLAGLMYGLASIVVLGLYWGIIQGIVGLVSFLILKYLDDTEKLKNPWQELLRGFFGTVLYVFA